MKQSGRVLYLHRTQGQGAEGAHIRGMVDGFRAFGWTVDIVGPPGIDPYKYNGPNKDQERLLTKLLRWFAGKAPQISFELCEVLYNVIALWKLHNQWRVGGPYTLIYERYALNSFAGAYFSRIKKCPLVLEVNDATVIERSRPLLLKKTARWIEGRVLNLATVLVTITEHFKLLLVSHHNLDPEKILVLPNAIDPQKYKLEKDKRFVRAKFGIPEDSIVLGCVGAFVQWHGLEFLVETMADQCEQYNLFFLFVGDGPVRMEVEARARKLGIEGRILFTGFVNHDQVPYFLDLIDICLVPGSNAHGSPMKLFEYMAAGKPVVLPAYQPLLDVVKNEQEGLFFEPENREELRHTLLKLIESPNLCKLLGRNGRNLVHRKFTWKNNALSVIEKVPLFYG